jgi:hypothetical protein
VKTVKKTLVEKQTFGIVKGRIWVHPVLYITENIMHNKNVSSDEQWPLDATDSRTENDCNMIVAMSGNYLGLCRSDENWLLKH